MAFNPIQYLGGLFGLNQGKDAYVKTPNFQINTLLQGKEPIWVSISNDESVLFQTTPELYAVLTTKASMVGNGIFKHYKMVGSKVLEVENSEYVKRLESPNVLQGRNEWLADELIQKSLYGNSFIYALKGTSIQEVPSALYNLPSSRMKIIPTGKIYKQTKFDSIISKFELVEFDGTKETFETKEVLFQKTSNPDNPVVGKSPLHSLQMPLSNIRGAYGFRNVLINERGAIGMVSNDTKDSDGGIPLAPTEAKKLEEQYVKNYGLTHGKSKLIVSSSSLKFTPFVYPTKDLMLFEEISEDFMKIIDVYGMNKYLFSNSSGDTFSNVLEGKRMAYQDGIIPYAEDFTYNLTKFLKLDLKGEWIELDYSHVESLKDNEKNKAEIHKLKAEAYNTLLQSGSFDPEILKEIIGLK